MKTLIINANTNENIVNKLKKHYNIIFTKEIKAIEGPLKYHTDIQITKINENTFVCEPTVFEYYNSNLKNVNIICGSTFLKSNYPFDIAYNITRVGDKCLCYEKYTDRKLLEVLNCNVINVKQGYSKCNICVLDENSIITSDEGIAKICVKNSIDVLKISEGQIELPPFKYGFIGGACMKIGNDEILFFGDITKHSDYKKIKDFCDGKNIKITYFTKDNLIDLGSGLFVCEYKNK